MPSTQTQKASEQLPGGRSLRRQIRRFVQHHLALLVVFGVTLTLGGLTAHSYFQGQVDSGSCQMSWSRPRFVLQTEFDKGWTRFADKYQLHLYREGGFDVHDEPYRIPVLFVPGNAGSHKQVRSISSAAAAAFVELAGKDPEVVERGQIGFDFFTVGLNEEFTALHGYSILEQADFINDAIRFILSRYAETRAKYRVASAGTEFALPTSVIVVGHSMGGVVARTAFTLPNHIVGSVQAIFTLSTPHNNPTASLEYYVDKVYMGVNSFWRHGFHNGTLDNVSLVSIAGGNRDGMINSDYAYVGDLAPARNALSVLSSGINDVWLSVDHQSILWCGQMAIKFARMLTMIMDARRPEQVLPLDERMRLMRRELYSGLEENFENVENTEVRKTTRDDYRYVKTYDDAILLTSADVLLMASHGNSPKKTVGLHLLPLDMELGPSATIQVAYEPDFLGSTPGEPVLLGCSRKSAGAAEDVQCQTIPVARTVTLPMRTQDEDADAPVMALKYLEAAARHMDGFDYLGLELPAKAGPSGYLRASIAHSVPRITAHPSYMQLLMPYTVKAPAKGGELNTRTRIKLHVPEDPFFVFSAQLAMVPNAGPGPARTKYPRFEPIVRQSDSRRFESKFWTNRDSFDLAIHGRGAYLPADELVDVGNLGAAPWDGLDIDVWADPDYYAGLSLTLQINWYSSLNRLVKRYDMALLALSFVWASLVLLHQLHAWSVEQQGAQTRFPSSLAAIERLVRNGTAAGLVIAGLVSPLVQQAVARAMQDTWRPSTIAWWNNLFMGVRGSGWTLSLVPALLVVASLGLVALEALALALVCNTAAWVAAATRRESTRMHWARHEVLLTIAADRAKPTLPVRPLVATVGFVVLVCTFVPYQFAFLVIYMAQLITAVRTLVHARLASPGGAPCTPTRVAARTVLDDRAQYQLALLLFWTSSLPYCAPELMVWVRNLSVLWLEDAPSDHNLASMAGYFALRLLAAHHVVPRLPHGHLRRVTCLIFAVAAAVAWLWSIRRPYILYDIGNVISAWLALVQFADFPLRLVSQHTQTPAAADKPSSFNEELSRKLR
ncbi:GPI inositol deacylase [Linderina pennispora]|nr:GPI inositol deacylase [Linderina pennispora]